MLDPITKTKLLIYGVKTDLKPLRKGGAGPTGGLGFRIHGSDVSAPAIQEFTKNSPFTLRKSDEKYILYENRKRIGEVKLPKAEYYKKSVGDIPANKLVALDGYNALVSAVSRKCIYWSKNRKCQFCTIQNSIQNAVVEKDPEKLAEAVRMAYEEDMSRHLTLTTGTANSNDKGAKALIEAVKAIKNEVNIDVHVQIEPVEKFWLERLYESGADTIGIHIETFDNAIRDKIVPGKPPVATYIKSWNDAVDIFGEWNVSSWLILGIGENKSSVIEGVKTMVEHTVYPFIAPFRPFNGSSHPSLKLDYFIQLINDLKNILRDSDQKIPEFNSGCSRCNGCSFMGELKS